MPPGGLGEKSTEPPRLVHSASRMSITSSTPLSDGIRKPCKFGLKCFRRKPDHLEQFSHPDDDDYIAGLRKYHVRGEFLTLRQCFRFADPDEQNMIKNKGLLGKLLWQLDREASPGELTKIWETIDDDGNGFLTFSEFVEWAQGAGGICLPIGLDAEEPGASTKHGLACGFTDCHCKCFRARPSQERFCACGHKRALHAAANDGSAFSAPSHWSCVDALANDSMSLVVCDDEVLRQVQLMADASARKIWTRDRGVSVPVPSRFEIVHVNRNENAKLWRSYALKRTMIKQAINSSDGDLPPFGKYTSKTAVTNLGGEALDTECNEWLLWHGTCFEGAEAICKVDFKQRLAGSATGTLYGPGTYFAESCTKADEYSRPSGSGQYEGLCTLLLCRVVGGRVRYTAEAEPNAGPEGLLGDCTHGPYDSVLGDREKCRGTFREFVVYASDQAYPEYIVLYRRKYDDS